MRRGYLLFLLLCVAILAGCKSGTAGKVIFVTIEPSGVNVVIGTTLQFTATVADTFDQDVTWSVVGGSDKGTISSSGLYTAPGAVPTPAQVTVMAISQKDQTKTATATIKVTATATPSPVSVLVSPVAASVAAFGTQQFTAMVKGNSNSAVTWQVNGTTGGSRTLGFISAGGLYVAPSGVPTTPTARVGRRRPR